MSNVSPEAKESAWSHFFNQALSDLTGTEDSYSDAGVGVSVPWSPEKLADRAALIADAAVKKMEARGIAEGFWPVAD
jgi:hypothetical protein